MTKKQARQKVIKYIALADETERKRKVLSENWYADYSNLMGSDEPLKPGHYSEILHTARVERRESFYRHQGKLAEKARQFREKADKLHRFANTKTYNSQKKQEVEWEQLDRTIKIGTKVDFAYVPEKIGTIVEIFEASYKADFGDFQCTDIKERFRPVTDEFYATEADWDYNDLNDIFDEDE